VRRLLRISTDTPTSCLMLYVPLEEMPVPSGSFVPVLFPLIVHQCYVFDLRRTAVLVNG